jgi:iron complex outermembrane receptor protein
MDTDNGLDLDGTTGQFATTTHLHNITTTNSAELNVTSKPDARFSWLFGALYLDEHGSALQDIDLYTITNYQSGGTIRTESRAVYGQTTIPILSSVNLTVAERYSHDRKQDTEFLNFFGRAADAGSKAWSANSPKVTLDWTPTDGLLVYATFAKSYKSGGFNLGALQGGPYNPEYVKDFEAGLKARLFDGRARAALTVFHYDYTDMQLSQTIGYVEALVNAGSSTIKGIELEGEANLTDRLKASMSYGYLDARFDHFIDTDPVASFNAPPGTVPSPENLAGKAVPNSPKHTLNLALEYNIDWLPRGQLTLRADESYKSRVFFTGFNADYSSQSGYFLLNARATYHFASSQVYLALFGSNLADRKYIVNYVLNEPLTGAFGGTVVAQRRIVGLELGTKF